ncbi:hypothetical protein DFR35_2410 [Sulfurisoma sediminicola]|uniref:Uncharacterized protein n=1 Tax=Sulfurisoma sediminicola TaxID=1381557 RepID=A0A497XB28_9PROT|nr:hypothetical protein DFR35_2410 [Sulfurisoma sediminicola]
MTNDPKGGAAPQPPDQTEQLFNPFALDGRGPEPDFTL